MIGQNHFLQTVRKFKYKLSKFHLSFLYVRALTVITLQTMVCKAAFKVNSYSILIPHPSCCDDGERHCPQLDMKAKAPSSDGSWFEGERPKGDLEGWWRHSIMRCFREGAVKGKAAGQCRFNSLHVSHPSVLG